jgi:hypothetical protein
MPKELFALLPSLVLLASLQLPLLGQDPFAEGVRPTPKLSP